MELLIVGGIALLGYNMSDRGRGPREPRRRRADRLSRADAVRGSGRDGSGDAATSHEAEAQRRWREARDPAVTGVVMPNAGGLGIAAPNGLVNNTAVLPFFTSARTQAGMSDGYKQTVLEAFTGANGMGESATGTYRRKREVEAMFAPDGAAGRVTSGGTVGNAPYVREDERYLPAGAQNNVQPMQKINVGRGVGVGPDVAAAGGFHPMYRVMLQNVGEYKKNNLPGGFNHGASAVTAAPGDGPRVSQTVGPKTGALEWDAEKRPPMRGRAAVLAATEHPDSTFTAKRQRVTAEDAFGAPARGAAGQEVRDRLGGRPDDGDRDHTLPQLNLAAPGGTGAYTHYSHDPSRCDMQQREMPGGSGFLKVPAARKATSAYALPPTQRDMTSRSYVGGTGGGSNAMGGAVRGQAPNPTLREGQNTATVLGAISAVKGGTMDNVWRYRRLGRQSKRAPEDTGGRALPGRINVMTGLGHTAVRAEAPAAAAQWMPSVRNKAYNDDPGVRTTPGNKLPVSNPRLALCTARDQLRDNPYARSWT